MLKDRQWHLKNNLTIFLEFQETLKILHELMMYSGNVIWYIHTKNLHRKGAK